MGSLRGTEVGAFFLFAAISVFPAFGQDAATTPNAAARRAVYPESADGLKSLITDILVSPATRKGVPSFLPRSLFQITANGSRNRLALPKLPASKPNMSISNPNLPIGCKREWKQ
jgi:hypothetical protein